MPPSSETPLCLGRYELLGELAAGGMATVHYGRLLGPVGFSRAVAIKRMYPQFAKDPEFVSMFLDEARLAARIQHPNVVATLDVVTVDGELFLVMDYVHGASLASLLASAEHQRQRMPLSIALSVAIGALHGLHAAHEARCDRGQPLGIVHRDVSPQNLLVGVDGVTRVLDFGVAKAANRVRTTRDGKVKGKIAYMPPEQLRGGRLDRRADVYSAAVVLWEALVGRRLFSSEVEAVIAEKLFGEPVQPPSASVPGLPAALDAIVERGLAANPADRFGSAREMAMELEALGGIASASEVGAWVERIAAHALSAHAKSLAQTERDGVTASLPKRDGEGLVALIIEPAPPSARREEGATTDADVSAARAPKSRRVQVAAVAALGLGAVLAAGFVSSAGLSDSVSIPALERAVAPAFAEVGRQATPAPTVAAEAEPVATPAPSADDKAAGAPSAAPRSPARAAARPRARADCRVPYVLDAEGNKRYKPECL